MLAELTQTFDKGDASYFFPLMQQTERRLGRKPRFGTLDKAYDAFYVYQYFHEAGGFAAVPLAERAATRSAASTCRPAAVRDQVRRARKFTLTDRTTTIVVHERGERVCRCASPPGRPRPVRSTDRAGPRAAAPP